MCNFISYKTFFIFGKVFYISFFINHDLGVSARELGSTIRALVFTSRYDSWRYASPQSLPQSDRILGAVMDMRLPLTFSVDDCKLIARIIRDVVSQVHQSPE